MKKSVFLEHKRAQVTIFIILAIIIVVGIVGVFLLTSKTSVSINPAEDPSGVIEKCIKDQIDAVVPGILAHGGLVSPSNSSDKSVLYDDKRVAYLCYAEDKLEICSQNTPLLKAKIEDEIKRVTTKKIEGCFSDLKSQLSGYDVKEGAMTYNIEITPTSLNAVVNKKLVISRGESSQEVSSFSYKARSPIFNFILLTNKILNEEVGCDCGNEACRVDVLELSRDNKDFEITLFVGGSDIEVYTIKDILTGQQFKFAVRNCANQ